MASVSVAAEGCGEIGVGLDSGSAPVTRCAEPGNFSGSVVRGRRDHRCGIEIEEDLHRGEHQQKKDHESCGGTKRAGAAFGRTPDAARPSTHGELAPMLPTSRSMFVSAAAERIGVTPRTLYRFIDEGQLPAFKFGRVIRLKKADVDTYIESCRVEPGSMSHLYPETLGGT